MNAFSELALIEPIQRAIAAENYTTPTPIQAQSIPHLLAGRDLLGCAQTGTGKTAAFALPILQRLAANRRPAGPRGARALILTPTRELAAQIGDSFRTYGRHLGLRHLVVFGGVGQRPQVQGMSRGVDILVATPGRLIDLIEQRFIRLDMLEIFVLDEADRMLDMGFIQPVRQIIKLLPRTRQTLFFSATMPPEVVRLADTLLSEPVKVEVTPVSSTAERIEQRVMFVARGDKRRLLTSVLQDSAIERVLVFTRTKHGANKVTEQLGQDGIAADAIHGNKSQGARQKALADFKSGRIRVLVATDIAARGIDIDGITHVVNFDLPNVPESYVHRIGRTARAGASGIAISFCDGEEKAYLRDIERLIRQKLIIVSDHVFARGERKADAPAEAGRPESRNGHRPGARPASGQKQRPRQQHGQHNGQRHGQRPQAQAQNGDAQPAERQEQRRRKRSGKPRPANGAGPLQRPKADPNQPWSAWRGRQA